MTITSKKQLTLIVFLIIIVLAISSFIVGYHYGYDVGFKSGKSATLIPVRIGHLTADIHQIALFIAYSKGWFEEEGLAPIRKEYLYGMPQMMAFEAGELDAGYVGCVPALITKSKGADLFIVASANLEGSAIVAKPEINGISELEGRKVATPGIGSIQDCMIRMVEKKFNLKMNIVHHTISNLPIFLEKGEIDAYIAWEPFCAESVAKGTGHVIYTSHDIIPNHQCCVLYVSGKLLRENPEIVKKLVKIHVKSMNFVRENPEIAKRIFAEMTGKSLEIINECWNRMVWDHHVNTESLKVFVPYLIEQGKISKDAITDVDKFIKELVNQEILAEVGG